jgi:IS5 family transposase
VIRLTPGNVADIRAAGDLLAAAQPLKRLIADKGYDANTLRQKLRTDGVQSVTPAGSTASAPFDMMRNATAIAGASRRLSAVSRTSAASQPATKSWRQTSCQPSPSQQSSPSGSE